MSSFGGTERLGSTPKTRRNKEFVRVDEGVLYNEGSPPPQTSNTTSSCPLSLLFVPPSWWSRCTGPRERCLVSGRFLFVRRDTPEPEDRRVKEGVNKCFGSKKVGRVTTRMSSGNCSVRSRNERTLNLGSSFSL